MYLIRTSFEQVLADVGEQSAQGERKTKTEVMTELILIIGIAQFLIPLLLLFWQWRERSASKVQWLFKTILAVSYLIAIALVGLWNVLPFFVPYLYLSTSLTLVVRGFLRIRKIAFWKVKTRRERIAFGLTALLAVLTSTLAIYALSAWRIPPGDAVQLAFPLKDGTFYIANGGSNSLLNPHLETLEGERYRSWRGQSYAVDILQINRWGLRANGFLPADPAQYRMFDTPVHAPCAGTILETENGREDLPPPRADRTYLPGNHVLIDCGEFLVLLAHFRKGSVAVTTDQQVEVGQTLGQVGNSGNTGEPHLHIHAQRRGTQPTTLDGEPLWILFDDKFLVRNQLVVR